MPFLDYTEQCPTTLDYTLLRLNFTKSVRQKPDIQEYISYDFS